MNEQSQKAYNQYTAAREAGDAAAIDAAWRLFVGTLEVEMGRTGSVEHLTPEVKCETRI